MDSASATGIKEIGCCLLGARYAANWLDVSGPIRLCLFAQFTTVHCFIAGEACQEEHP